MDKSFQKEILERRNTILFKKELNSINPKHTIKPKKNINNSEYLIIGENNNFDKNNFDKNNELNKYTSNNLKLNISNNSNNSDKENEKQVIIDLYGNNKNTINNRNLICLGIFLVASYIGITIINDYIMINHF